MASKESLLEKVRRTCRECTTKSPHVKINHDQLNKWADAVDTDKVNAQDIQKFPLKFSVDEEINFRCTLNLLNFASGYRTLLHKHCQVGAYQTIIAGLFGMYLTNSRLNDDFLMNLDLQKIGTWFRIPLQVDVEIGPAMYRSDPSPLLPLAKQILAVLKETGAILRKRKCKDFANFIRLTLVDLEREFEEQREKERQESDVDNVEPDQKTLERLRSRFLMNGLMREFAATFPAFDDRFDFKDGDIGEVCLFKKLQLLLSDLYLAFEDKPDSELAFIGPHIDEFTVFSDNVLPTVLRHLGILEVSAEVAEKIDSNTVIPRGPVETSLRAAAVHACELITLRTRENGDASQSKINEVRLDHFLWQLGKDDRFRSKARHATRDTVFY